MSRPVVHVHFLPLLVDPADLAEGAVVVIDVLRASTTITHALAAGAKSVVPCREVDDARALAARLSAEEPVVTGGERCGLPIPGFDLGNSPTAYTPASVGGKTVIFTTTNGTLAMERCRAAERVFIGAFVNRSAVSHKLHKARAEGLSVHLLCAGTGGKITREDVLFAGSLVDLGFGTDDESFGLNDQAILACDAWRQIADKVPTRRNGEEVELRILSLAEPELSDEVARELARTQGGRNLKRIGLAADIVDAAQVDLVDLVPQLHIQDWTIRPAE